MSQRHWIAIAALLFAGCTVQETARPNEPTRRAPVAAEASAPVKAAEIPPLMTQDEADAKAAQAIKKENADAELEKLKQELSGG